MVFVLISVAVGNEEAERIDRARHDLHSILAFTEPAAEHDGFDLEFLSSTLSRVRRWVVAWYAGTPPADRVIWAGMTACAGLGLAVLLERLARLRRRSVVPSAFTARFLDRLHDGKLDCGQALDHCELNPSPAARVALAAARRWGRPPADLERAVALAHRVETDSLRRNVGTLRRIAVLAPLLGLLGTLFALGRALDDVAEASAPEARPTASASALPNARAARIASGSALSTALTPISAGIIIATLALVAYDGLLIRIEKLAGGLDRLGAETIDAIAMTAPISSPALALAPDAAQPSGSRREIPSGKRLAPTRVPERVRVRQDEGNDPLRRFGPPETGF
jgi:biopolymer transport protein ExbB